ncbi:olfactory receptor 2B2-like [Gastrophryne carolinensis]
MTWKNNTALHEFVLLGLTSHHTLQIALFIMFLFNYLIILFANSLIILATATDSKLHTPMYFFLTNLSVVDILFSSSVMPRMLRDLLATKKTILFGECLTQSYVSVSLGITECIILTVLAYDRYIAICFPLHYTAIINRAACNKIAVGTWTSGFLFPIAHVILTWNMDLCGHYKINHFFCEIPSILSLGCRNVGAVELLNAISCIILLFLPICFIIMTYLNIIRAILRISYSAGRRKTFSTCGSHITVVTMFYGTVAVTYMKPRSNSFPDTDKIFAIFYILVTPMMNPLVYTLSNKEVKSALKSFSICQIKFP